MKARVPVYIVLIVLFLVLQSTLLEYVRIYSVKPNLLIIFIACVALLRGSNEGAVVGFFAGLAMDMAAGRLLGFYALVCMFLGLIVGYANRRLYRENYMVTVFFTFIATILYEASVYALFNLMNGNIDMINAFLLKILPEAIYNSFASVFIFALLVKLDKRFEDAVKASRKY